MAMTITYNIPWYQQGVKNIRKPDELFKDLLTFYNANKDERSIIQKSLEQPLDALTGFRLPKLRFSDQSHLGLASGTGGPLPDLVTDDGTFYEVKRNYFTAGSRSSLHKGTRYLINCTNQVIEIYDITVPKWEIQIPARFRNVLSTKITDKPTWLAEQDKELLSSGRLAPKITSQVTKEGFSWNF